MESIQCACGSTNVIWLRSEQTTGSRIAVAYCWSCGRTIRQTVGVAIKNDPFAPGSVYVVECWICQATIESPFWDVVQEHLDACWSGLSPRQQGKLEAFDPNELDRASPVSCETEMRMRGIYGPSDGMV